MKTLFLINTTQVKRSKGRCLSKNRLDSNMLRFFSRSRPSSS